jgi:uracil-DNA glycosylase
VTIRKIRGQAMSLADGTRLFVTVHPSSLLRIEDENEKQKAYRQFVTDLKEAAAKASSE